MASLSCPQTKRDGQPLVRSEPGLRCQEKIFSGFGSAGATYLSGPMTGLSGDKAGGPGINIEVLNFYRELTVTPGTLFFGVDLSQFRSWTSQNLGIDVQNKAGGMVFGAAAGSLSGNSC